MSEETPKSKLHYFQVVSYQHMGVKFTSKDSYLHLLAGISNFRELSRGRGAETAHTCLRTHT